MTNPNLTEIAVILDRSGSMDSIRRDMEGGFNAFMAEQAAFPDPCVVSLYQFDDVFEVVYEAVPISRVPPLNLQPRGWTALLDAMGRGITLIGERFARQQEFQRPGKVIVLVITDGHENKSREWSRPRVAELVRRQREVYNWQFAFLGANIDSFAEGSSVGVQKGATLDFQANSAGVGAMYGSLRSAVSRFRRGKVNSPTGASLTFDGGEDP